MSYQELRSRLDKRKEKEDTSDRGVSYVQNNATKGGTGTYQRLRSRLKKSDGTTSYVKSSDLGLGVNSSHMNSFQDDANEKIGSSITGYNDDDAAAGWEAFQKSQREKREKEMEKSWVEKALAMLGDTSDSSIPGASFSAVVKAFQDDTSYREPTEKWSEQQRKDFGFLYQQDQNKAFDYAEKVNTAITKAEKEKEQEKITEKATKSVGGTVAHTAGALATAPLGLADYMSDLAEQVARGKITEREMSPFEYSQTVTSGISRHLNDKYGTLDEDIPIIGGKGLGDVYGLGTSIAQSSLAAATGGQAGTLVQFFGSAAAAGVDEAKNRGASDEQALQYGTMAGAAEGLAEMIGVDNLFKIGSAATMREALKNVLKQGAAEGIEEGLTSVMNNFADQLVMGDKSNFNVLVRDYMNKGWSQEEAKKQAWIDMAEDVAFDVLGGFVSGAVHAGPQTAYQTYAENKAYSSAYGESAMELVEQGLESAEGSLSHELAVKYQEKLNAGGTLTGAEINRLVKANEQRFLAEDKAAIRQAAENRLVELGETDNVSGLAEILMKQATKQKLTVAEKTAIQTSRYGQRVADEMNPENVTSGWASQIGTSRLNADAYNADLMALAQEKVARDASRTDPAKASDAFPSSGSNLTTAANDGVQSLHEVDADTILEATLADMGVNESVAKVLMDAYQTDTSVNASVYAKGIQEAYRYGEFGYPQQELAKGPFSSLLTEHQRNTAYRLGNVFGKEKAAKAQAVVAKNATTTEKSSVVGKVHFEGDSSKLTERQRASISALETVADVMGVQIYVFQSELNEAGQRVGANGWYDPSDNSIHIDLHAGAKGEGTMLFTAAHELTHHVKKWSPEKFRSLSDFLMQEYGEKGVSVEELVQRQIQKAKNSKTHSRELTYDEAFEEVIADSMESMLADGNVVEKLEKLKQQDRTLWQKIKDFISELAQKIREVYKGMAPDSAEGRFVAEMKDSIEKLQELFTEALVDASENFQASEQVLAQAGISVDSKTDAGSIYSVRDVLSEADRNKVAKALTERFGVTDKEAKEWLKAETSLASLILNPKYSMFLDYEADPNEVAIKQNSDYPQGTVDFSNICKKRREFTQVMNRVLRNFPNHVFAATDLAKIRTIMGEEGMTLPCGICYVEDRRQLDTIVAQDNINGLKLYREGSKTRPDGKPFNANQSKGLKLTDGDTYVPSIYELVTLEGRNSLKAKNPNMEAAWVRYNNARGMQAVRLLTNEAEYKRQILKYGKNTVKSKNDHGGLRIYSFSDMEMFHLIDIIQVITDSAAVGLKIQGYTKVNEYAKAVKDTGLKLNRSLIPKGDLGYHMEDGKVVLDYDTVEGIDIHSEDFFDNRDNPNVGNITIGVNDTQIRAAMVSNFVDQIIPFHTGQSEDVLGEKGIAAWDNYKDFQTEKDLATGKTSSHQVNIYTEVFRAAEEEGKPIQNKKQFVEKFLQVCKDNGLKPRFAQFLNIDAQGNYIYTEGYHKFLVDFKTFAQTEVGEYLPQMPVKPIFDDAYLTSLLEAYVKEQRAKDAEVAKQMPKVIERITNEIIKPDEVKYSDRNYDFSKSFAEQLDDFQNSTFPARDTFVLGGTPEVLKQIGFAGLPMTMNQKHIGDSLYGTYKGSQQEKLDHTFTLKELAKLPEKIADPIAVIYDKRIGKANPSESNVDVLVEMKVASKKQVICAVQIGGNGHINGLRIDTNKVATVHGNTDSIARLIEAINENEKGNVAVFYVNKEKTTKVLQSAGNPIPRGLSNLDGFVHSISDPGSPVKLRLTGATQTQQFMRWFGDWKNHPDKASKAVNKDGSPKKLYRYTNLERRVIAPDYRGAIWMADNDWITSDYGSRHDVLYANIKNPHTLNVGGDGNWDIDQTVENAKKAGKDGLIVNFVFDRGSHSYYQFMLSNDPSANAREVLESIKECNTALAAPEETIAEFAARMKENNNIGFSYYAVFKQTDVKSATENIGTFDGENPDIYYQDRPAESVSNRSLLANAFEGVAQNEIERNKIAEYKEKISLINSEERKLQKLNEQIKDLSFAKGPRDTAKIRELRDEAIKTANRIDIFDKQLLRLEASKPLQAVLNREKKKAYQRAERKGKEAMAEYKAKAERKQRETVERYQASREKGIESRRKTEMRQKIQKVVGELNQYLIHGTKERHVPIGLQKAVAEALDAVNMDTVGAEERIAKLEAELMQAKTPEDIQAISRRIDHIREMGDKMSDRLKALKDAYDEIINSDDPLIANSHDNGISAHMMTIIVRIGDTPLRDMNLEQLQDVYDVYRMVLTTIRNANKAFKAARSESIATLGNRVMEEVEKVGGKRKYNVASVEAIKKFGWNNLKPVYAFEHIGSDTFTQVFNAVRDGEDVWAQDVTEAREFYLEKSRKFKYDSWNFDKRYGFTSTSGMNFSLGLEQIMSLYAYSKREQAADHLKRGGIVIDETTEITMKTKMGFKVKFNPTEATAYNISDETLAEIISKLTPEQKGFVDEMQEYLSTTMGEKGNEVSLELYGIKLFKEKFYFPLKSATQFMAKAKEQQQGEVKIKNSGFSKETVKKANNPIVLTPFMNVWSSHVNEMSMYHAFVLPMEDFYRVWSYRTSTSEDTATESVEMFIQNAYGKGATKYIDQLLKDLNGGARTDSTAGIINKGMGLFKKGAVFASLSVVVQQPSSIARAAALVDTKYFIGPKVDHKRHKALWNEVKQYAPVAIIKEMGYFDTNMGKSTQDFLMGKEYSGIKEKMKALVTDSNYRDEILSKAPALADEMAWCSIWEAVKRETRAKNPGMKVSSEEFLQKAGKRFTEVITKTQVYDSVLARSANMRSKDTGMKMATAFMGEPTTSINMVADALLKGKRGNRKYCRTAIGAVIASNILNSILVSFVYAGRDDDEDETYVEKYIGALTGEILDGMNPATYIPFIKDIVSIVQGYDVERSDMAVISDLWNAYQKLGSDKLSAYRKVEGFAGSIAQIFGLPVKNIMRDVRGIYQTVDSIVNGQQTTKAGIVNAVKGAVTGETVSNQQQLYEAYLSGDKVQITRVEGRYKDQKAIDSAIRKGLRENDPRIAQAAQAKFSGDLDEYMRLAKAIIGEKHFSQDNVVAAINAEINALDTSESTSSSSKAAGMFKVADFGTAVTQGDSAMANAIKSDIIRTAENNGKTAEEAEKSFNSSAKSELKERFLSGEITEQKTIQALTAYCGIDAEDAKADVQYWAFKQEYPDTYADDNWFDAYYEKVASSGISIDVYMDYRNSVADITGEGKKERRMAVIDSLPITSGQKDALYYAEGWAESKLSEAPWH